MGKEVALSIPSHGGLLPTSLGLGEHIQPRAGDGGGMGVTGSRGSKGDKKDLGGGGDDTYSVTLGAWQAGSTTLSRHTLQTGGALVPGGTGSTSITLGERDRKRPLVTSISDIPELPRRSNTRPGFSSIPGTRG